MFQQKLNVKDKNNRNWLNKKKKERKGRKRKDSYRD